MIIIEWILARLQGPAESIQSPSAVFKHSLLTLDCVVQMGPFAAKKHDGIACRAMDPTTGTVRGDVQARPHAQCLQVQVA